MVGSLIGTVARRGSINERRQRYYRSLADRGRERLRTIRIEESVV